MAVVGAGVAAPVSLLLYRAMHLLAPGTTPLLAAAKFVIDQVVGCALWQAAYCALHAGYRTTLLEWLATRRAASGRLLRSSTQPPPLATPAC